MHTYARIANGVVVEVIEPATDSSGNEIPIAGRFHPLLVADMVDITTVTPAPQQNWTAVETNGAWAFSAPAAASGGA